MGLCKDNENEMILFDRETKKTASGEEAVLMTVLIGSIYLLCTYMAEIKTICKLSCSTKLTSCCNNGYCIANF